MFVKNVRKPQTRRGGGILDSHCTCGTMCECPSMSFLPVRPIARIPDESDVNKKTLTAFPWKTGGDHKDALVLWMKTIQHQQDLKSNNLCLNAALTWLRIIHSGGD